MFISFQDINENLSVLYIKYLCTEMDIFVETDKILIVKVKNKVTSLICLNNLLFKTWNNCN